MQNPQKTPQFGSTHSICLGAIGRWLAHSTMESRGTAANVAAVTAAFPTAIFAGPGEAVIAAGAVWGITLGALTGASHWLRTHCQAPPER